MSENFYTILTATGKAKLANSAVLGSKVNFKTLKVGDGNGAYYEPTESHTSLVREVWSGNVSSISVDENNPNWIVAETLIPATIGGFFIREAGIFDEDGDLIAISKLSETYKPVVSEGSIKDLCIKIILEVSNVESVTLKIDPTVIVATRKDIDVLQAKMDASNAQTAEEIKELDSKLSEQISELADEISNKTVVTPAIGYGMNNAIKNLGETSVSPKFTIQGKTVLNLLGKDGNCEDASSNVWGVWQCTTTLDSSNKVFGSNSLKVAATNTTGNMTKNMLGVIDKTKYYCFSAYLKNFNITNGLCVALEASSDTYKNGNMVTDTTKFTRSFLKIQPTDIDNSTAILLHPVSFGGATTGQYAYVDGVMLEEITQAQYNDPNFQPSPYVESYACLQNPYIEVRHDNLVRNGNGEEGIAWWTGYNQTDISLSLENGKFKVISTQNDKGMTQPLKLKTNTNYYLFANVSGNTKIAINDKYSNYIIGNGVFNTGNGEGFYINMWNKALGTGYVDSIMLVEGTTVPTSYKTCRIERCVVEGKFADGDYLVLENGEVTGQINWKHKTLFGKDYDWQFGQDFTGNKSIWIPSSNTNKVGIGAIVFSEQVVKYDGSIIIHQNVFDGTKSNASCINANLDTYLEVADTDTGWSESINPNNDEVKAFMNGWKAIYNNGTRYLAWISIVDNSIPYTGTTATSTTSATAGTNIINVYSPTGFSVSDSIIVIKNGVYYVYVITAINGNAFTLNNNIPVAYDNTWLVCKCDNGSTNASLLTYCKNNVAPGYDGYQLHYKLQNPEPLTDVNTHINGDIPLFDAGDNYLYIDSGMVLGEVANPDVGSGYANINITPRTANYLKYKNEKIYTLYKNNIFDNKASVGYRGTGDVNINSVGYGYVLINQSDFDTSATYTVDYKILETQAPQIGVLACEYVIDILSVLNKVQEQVNNKQSKDSILGQIVDLSSYEIAYGVVSYPAWFHGNGVLSVRVDIPFSVNKKVQPKVTIQQYYFNVGSGTGQSDYKSKVYIGAVNISRSKVTIRFDVYDSTVISNIKTYGLLAGATIIADCRERI